jgi:hypothetical protein
MDDSSPRRDGPTSAANSRGGSDLAARATRVVRLERISDRHAFPGSTHSLAIRAADTTVWTLSITQVIDTRGPS